MRRKSNVNFYVLPKISPSPSVQRTIRTSDIQPLTLKLLKQSFSCQKIKNENNENFLCILRFFLCVVTVYLCEPQTNKQLFNFTARLNLLGIILLVQILGIQVTSIPNQRYFACAISYLLIIGQVSFNPELSSSQVMISCEKNYFNSTTRGPHIFMPNLNLCIRNGKFC